MESQSRVKIKVGDHTFESEGSPEDVATQYRMFMELVGKMPISAPTLPQKEAPDEQKPPDSTSAPPNETSNDIALSKIMKSEGRVISLTVRPKNIGEAALLLMLGQKVLRSTEYITGFEVIEGLRNTGGFTVGRVDKLLEKIAADGDILITGERRGKKYRMTNAGMTKARRLAQDLVALVP